MVPRPADLTPAGTSSYVKPALAAALRAYHPRVEETSISSTPSSAEIRRTLQRLHGCDLVVLGTINAFSQPRRSALAHEVLRLNVPTVIAALRLPYDLASFPQAQTYVCTYSVLEPSMRALVGALFGKAAPEGKLPVSIPAAL